MQLSLPSRGDRLVSDACLPWHRASTLTERLEVAAPDDIDRGRGEKRLMMWTELAPLAGQPGSLDERLRPLGVTGEGLVELLGETDSSLAHRFAEEPAWHQAFRRWWSSGTAVPPHARLVGPDMGLLEWVRPLLEGVLCEFSGLAREKLAGVTNEPTLAEVDHVVDVLCVTVPIPEILEYVRRTLVLELNVARMEERLEGDTPAERYASFVSILADRDAAMALWQEYPVLARLVVDQLTFWRESRAELLDALIQDLPQLRTKVFKSREPRRLERVEFGAGDKHRRGRCVAVLTFDTVQVVYKPRSLAMDVAFDRVLEWLNERGLPHELTRLEVVDRGDHGWVEFVDTSVRTDEAGGDRYAWRLGALTAVLYLLHATDFHHENILATGDNPVLVDLEALLHTDKTAAVVKVDGVQDIAAVTLANSVQSVGVVPNRLLVRGADGTFGLDVSALAGDGGQLTPMPVPFWEDLNTDVMRLVDRRVEMDAERNHPIAHDGKPLSLVSRAAFFVEGFNDAYAQLQAGKESLLAADGPMAGFRPTLSRLIARPTHIYARLLLESTHPDFLRDGLDRDRSLARLCAGHDNMDCRIEMVQDEIAELRHGDIPMFLMEADTGVIRAGLDGQPIGRRTPPPLNVAATRARGLSDEDRAFQEWVIRSSIAATTMGGSEAQWPNWHRDRQGAEADSAEFAEEAQRVARHLLDLALRDADSVGWIGLGLVDEAFWQLAPAPMDSYIGTSGIAHALDAVATVTDDEQIRSLAVTVFDQIAHRAALVAEAFSGMKPKSGPSDIGIGAFSALGGTVFTLAHAAVRHERPDYARAAQLLLPSIGTIAEEDLLLDVVSGASGAILALLSLECAMPGCGALDTAERCAARLLSTRRETDDGWGWITPINPAAPLAGFSHGASGSALALARLNAVRPRSEYVEAVRQALRYEATTYDGMLQNWRDLRPANLGGRTVMNTWCHGAPGIALARHELLRLGTVPDLADELEVDRHRGVLAAISSGLDQDPVSGLGNHSLCHGDIGNLLIVQKAHVADREPEVHELLPRVWNTLLCEGRANGWLCGVPYGVETPGLMTGLAGIAWGLARYASPEQVPDVLAVDEPVTSHEAREERKRR